jgi:hypothetical protein
MTAKEAAKLTLQFGDGQANKILDYIRAAPAAELQEFMHGIQAHADSSYFNWARTALDIRISEATTQQAETLRQQVATLVGIAEAQRVLAAKLDRQTNKLIRLTWGLMILTLGLLLLTMYLGYDAYLKRKSGETAKPHAAQKAEFYDAYGAKRAA